MAKAVRLFAAADASREQTETLVKDMLKTWETGDAEKFAAAFDDKALFAYPGDRLDKPHLVEMFKNYHQDKSDIKIYFGQFLVDGDQFRVDVPIRRDRPAERSASGGWISGHRTNREREDRSIQGILRRARRKTAGHQGNPAR